MFTTSDIERYFNEEKQQALWFAIIGIAAIATALVFFFAIKTSLYKGAAVPLLLVGLLAGIVGFTVYKRSDADRIRNVYAYGMDPSQLKNKELPRMQKVMRNFVIYRYTEIVLLLVGIALFFYCSAVADKIFWKGFGLSLAIMGLLAFTADYVAAKRGQVYTNGLQSFIQNSYK